MFFCMTPTGRALWLSPLSPEPAAEVEEPASSAMPSSPSKAGGGEKGTEEYSEKGRKGNNSRDNFIRQEETVGS